MKCLLRLAAFAWCRSSHGSISKLWFTRTNGEEDRKFVPSSSLFSFSTVEKSCFGFPG